MKKLILFALAATFALASCNSDNPNKNTKFVVDTDGTNNRGEIKMSEQEQTMMKVYATIEAEKKSGKTYKEVFPGYDFGMNAKQIERTNKKMARKGEVEKYKKAQKRTYAYAYNMPILGGDAPALFNFAFDKEGKMFKGEGVIKVPSGSSSLDILNVTADLFNEWFETKPTFELPTYNYCARYVWVTGNRMVDLRCEVEGVVVSFYNLDEEVPNLYEQAPVEAPTKEEINPLLKEETDSKEETMQTSK